METPRRTLGDRQNQRKPEKVIECRYKSRMKRKHDNKTHRDAFLQINNSCAYYWKSINRDFLTITK